MPCGFTVEISFREHRLLISVVKRNTKIGGMGHFNVTRTMFLNFPFFAQIFISTGDGWLKKSHGKWKSPKILYHKLWLIFIFLVFNPFVIVFVANKLSIFEYCGLDHKQNFDVRFCFLEVEIFSIGRRSSILIFRWYKFSISFFVILLASSIVLTLLFFNLYIQSINHMK